MKKEQKKCLKCRDTRHRDQKQRGITLIALVITIILLLILAGVTLKIVLDNNFVDKAEKSVEKYSEAQKNETEQIKYFLENYLGEVDNTEGKEHRTLNGADPAYNNPIIPVGFKTSSEGATWSSIDGKTVSGWNDGLVIEDKEGNQFVWVPVDGTNVKYEKWLGKNNNAVVNSLSKLSEDVLPVSNEQTQIINYGGFYIGRYEAGISESMTEAIKPIVDGEETTLQKVKEKRDVLGKPVVKKNQVPWNCISYTNAKENAESMYTEEKVKSGLITGTMWDTTMKWLENSGVNVQTDSREWGNHYDAEVSQITKYSTDYGINWTDNDLTTKEINMAWMLLTGNTDYTKRKNIYDLAGNIWEMTNELIVNEIMYRGGCLSENGVSRQADYRAQCEKSDWWALRGFRVALYVQ